MWNPFKKSEKKKREKDDQLFIDAEWEIMRAKADAEAVKIYRKIYSLFKERIFIHELKEGDNFILLQENPIKICDDKVLNKKIIFQSIYRNYKRLPELIPELNIGYGREIKTDGGVVLCYEKYYLYTINITRNNKIELYDIKFRVHPSRQQINNGNEICVEVYSVDKNIYEIIRIENIHEE